MIDPERPVDVAEAMAHLDRRRFLPPGERAHAHENRALPIGHGQTCSQPSTVSTMLRALHVPVGGRVLDVGSGSGWTTALLGRLVGPTGSVLGLELEPALAAWGASNLAAWSMRWARIELAEPGALGRPVEDGWPRILVSAAARTMPTELVDQLADGGRMVIPVSSTLWLVERAGDVVTTTDLGSFSFVPLR